MNGGQSCPRRSGGCGRSMLGLLKGKFEFLKPLIFRGERDGLFFLGLYRDQETVTVTLEDRLTDLADDPLGGPAEVVVVLDHLEGLLVGLGLKKLTTI